MVTLLGKGVETLTLGSYVMDTHTTLTLKIKLLVDCTRDLITVITLTKNISLTGDVEASLA